jgi:hypothetical protein
MKRAFTIVALALLASSATAQDADLFKWRCGKTIISYSEEERPESGGSSGPDNLLVVTVTNPPPGKMVIKIRTTEHAFSTWGAELNGKACAREPYGAISPPRLGVD